MIPGIDKCPRCAGTGQIQLPARGRRGGNRGPIVSIDCPACGGKTHQANTTRHRPPAPMFPANHRFHVRPFATITKETLK